LREDTHPLPNKEAMLKWPHYPAGHQFDILREYYGVVPIERSELDRLEQLYKDAVDRWVAAIREEESLATPDHSIVAWEIWEKAGFNSKEVEDQATAAKEAYKNGLRNLDYDIT
jgi:hypothetical protein